MNIAKIIVVVMALMPWPIAGYVVKHSDLSGVRVMLISVLALICTAWMLSYYPEPKNKSR